MKRSLYREYRPQTFAELVGQDHVARTLRNAVETGQVAHAYVFAGPRGTGKTSTARILAKALNCVGTDEAPVTGPTATPCGVCRHCLAIAGGASLDVVEMDAASHNKVDDVRELRDTIAFAPIDGRFKVYIVDEVHMLSNSAFNALLKTLEEPPDDVVFVLATTEPHKIPETIISRCQMFDFHRPQVVDIVRLLESIVEGENARPEEERGSAPIEIQDEALHIIARHSQGGFRDAIGTLDKLATYSDGAITAADVLEALGVTSSELLFEITDIVTERRTAEALQFVQRLANAGTDYAQFIRDLLRHLRQLFLLQHLEEAASDEATLRTLGQTVELDGELFREHLQRAGQVPPREVVSFIEALGRAQREIRDGLDPRLQLELALVKVTRPEVDHSAAALEERLRRLEIAAVHAGAGAVAASPAPRSAPTTPRARQAAAAPAVAADGASAVPAAPDTAAPAGPPAPAPAEDTAPEPPQELTLERVKRAWELILQRVQAERVPLYGFLRDGRPTALHGHDLVISIPSDFALRNARQGDNAAVLAEAVENVLGRPVSPRFELVSGAEPAPAAASAPPAAGPAGPGALPDFTDQIRAAQATLDAELLPDDS
jgi:DNA polymerase-3 subunit gamma/tau